MLIMVLALGRSIPVAMRTLLVSTLCCCLIVSSLASSSTLVAGARRKVVIGYLFPQDRLLTASEIVAGQLTRINYAFANVKKGLLVEGFVHDRENLRMLTGLRRQYPNLQVLISVGGWSWSGGFSDVALTFESRSRFIESAVKYIRENALDGIDIDWEYPGLVGNRNKHRREDKENFTALLRELRQRLHTESRELRRPLLISIAAGASEEYLANTEMAKAQLYLESVNLMSYDYYTPSADKTTGHHAPLRANPADPKHVSVEASVRLFEAAGVPAGKIVLGVPFYGHAWTHVSDVQHGLFQPGKKSDLEPAYKTVPELVSQGGFVRYWDRVAEAPYLYNSDKRTFITYEDPESIRLKCQFVLRKNLGGVMFWGYSNDASGELLTTITRSLRIP